MTRAAAPPGLDPAALQRWWDGELGDDPATALTGPLTASLIAGGKSNLTYRVGDGARTWVLRRPPLGHVLATAHDMAREHRVISALAPTAVPVPATHALCEDADVLGAPFYVMADVPGTPYRTAAQLAPLGAERTRTLAGAMVDVLARLHQVDPDSVGLGNFGRIEGFLPRQVRRWRQQMAASATGELVGEQALAHRLESGAAEAERVAVPGIVHGDYRLDNLLVAQRDGRDEVTAVLDWEMATLGDTLTDVALMVLYHRLAAMAPGAVADASTAPGFPDEHEVLERYAAASGRDLAALGFHLGLASYKLAAILQGIHYRHLHGQTVGAGFDRVGELVEPLLEAGLEALTTPD